jgi:hypothetical protein
LRLGRFLQANRSAPAWVNLTNKLRRYLIFDTKAREPARELLDAIDNYVEKLTGDRRTLHGQNHGIG